VLCTLGEVGDWRQEHLVSPVDDLLRLIPEGGAMADRHRCRRLAEGIDMVFRTEVSAQYSGWPPGSTTDGALADICVRSGRYSLEAIGLMYIDIAGDMFPFRAVIERTESLLSMDGFIGQVDERTGHPPRLPRGTLVNPVRDGSQSAPVPELISGHRASPIAWKKALSWSWSHTR
jgi:hypothetical protein